MTKRTVLLAIAALLLAAAAILAGVYGRTGGESNRQVAACDGSQAVAGRLAGLNVGQVAAFQIADEPRHVGDLTFTDGEGGATGLADHAGQTVLLNLWATWCAPCREEMPTLARLQAAMGDESFQVLPVSMDSGKPEKPKRFYAENDLSGLPFRHDGSLDTFNKLKKMSIAIGMPTTVLVDGQGCAVGWMNGPADWASEDARALIRAALGGS